MPADAGAGTGFRLHSETRLAGQCPQQDDIVLSYTSETNSYCGAPVLFKLAWPSSVAVAKFGKKLSREQQPAFQRQKQSTTCDV
eukprot:1236518-Amphidinium_carterae.1